MALYLLILLSVLFVATHFALSHGRLREGLKEKLGQLPFLAVYSLVSIATLGGAILVFAYHRHQGALLWSTPGWLYPPIYLLMLIAFLFLALSLANPSPASLMPAAMEPRGILRITRHPMDMGLAAFALAHVIANGFLGDVVFFGSIFVVGFLGVYHQDRRKAREKGEAYRALQEKTSIFPFAAIIRGKTTLEPGQFSLPLILIAVIAFLVVLFLHQRLFGVAPY